MKSFPGAVQYRLLGLWGSVLVLSRGQVQSVVEEDVSRDVGEAGVAEDGDQVGRAAADFPLVDTDTASWLGTAKASSHLVESEASSLAYGAQFLTQPLDFDLARSGDLFRHLPNSSLCATIQYARAYRRLLQ